MSYQGYPQQPQWHGGGGGYGGYPQQPPRSTNPATAIIAGILGLGLVAALTVAAVDFTDSIANGNLGDLPGEFLTILIGLYAIAAIGLIGAILVFVRKVAGAFLLLTAALLTLVLILLEPTLIEGAVGKGPSFGDFFEDMFKFDSGFASGQAIGLIIAPIVLIFAIIPPTLKYLKGSANKYPGYDPYQQQGGYPGW